MRSNCLGKMDYVTPESYVLGKTKVMQCLPAGCCTSVHGTGGKSGRFFRTSVRSPAPSGSWWRQVCGLMTDVPSFFFLRSFPCVSVPSLSSSPDPLPPSAYCTRVMLGNPSIMTGNAGANSTWQCGIRSILLSRSLLFFPLQSRNKSWTQDPLVYGGYLRIPQVCSLFWFRSPGECPVH